MNDQAKREESKTKKMRSPNYPTIPLEKAIELARKLYEKYFRASTPVSIAMDYLGYSPKSSSGMQRFASLSYYGLITTEGTGKDKRIKISDMAFTIIKSPDQGERNIAIKTAALNPAIFSTLLEKYNNQIPNEDILAYDLEKEGFNPNSIRDFINIFSNAISLAKISDSDIIETDMTEPSGQINEPIGDKNMTNIVNIPQDPRGRQNIPIQAQEREIANYPVGKGLKARILISGESTVTTEAVEKLIKLLQLNKEDLSELTTDAKEPTE